MTTENISWDFPYASGRMPVMARNVVATSQPLAAEAGLDAIRRGGNAVDAALTAAIALTVVEPANNGLGSDAFAIVWDGERLHGLNASGKSPKTWTPDRFSGLDEMPTRGWDSVTTPGAVSAWAALSEKFGKLPFEDLCAPAIKYASEGYHVTPKTAFLWELAVESFADYPDFARTFLVDGRAPRTGEVFHSPNHAATLEAIAATKGEAFYRGALAEKIVAHARATGGAISEDDLAEHEAVWVEPVSRGFQGDALHEIPPNGQGLAALIALGILEHTPHVDAPLDSADSLHFQIEAMKLAFADAHRYICDPDGDASWKGLLDDAYLAERARLIDPRRASSPQPGVPRASDTVYLTAADDSGMMVSFIQSNFWGFGSGIVVPDTGIALQNRACGFSLEPGHPNRVDGGKRPFHTIIPGFVTRDGAPLMSFGVMGGPMQPQGHLQMMTRTSLHGQNVQAASDAPRWMVLDDGDVAIEPGLAPEVYDILIERGHKVVRDQPQRKFGGAQLIQKIDGGYVAGTDHRKDGLAVGF